MITCHVLEVSGKISDDGLMAYVCFSLSYSSIFHLCHLIGWSCFFVGENTAWKFSSDPATLCFVAASVGSKIFTCDSLPWFFVPCVKNIVASFFFSYLIFFFLNIFLT